MGSGPDRLVGYGSRVVAGLVMCAVLAATLHADAAALTILMAVTLVVLAVTAVMLRHGRL
jgi:hypothetical protein